MGSNPIRSAKFLSVLGVNGQHVWLATKGCRFKSDRTLHQGVAQLARVPVLDAGCRWFESNHPDHFARVRSSTAEQVTFNHHDEGANPSEPTMGP